MARPIVLSNGELHVGINRFGLVHDFYFPYVGLENHAAGRSTRHMVGVWVDGEISWLDHGDWQFRFHYPHRALIGHTIATNERMGILLEFDDVVDAHISAFMRNVHVVNLRAEPREIRLFMHQAFVIGDSYSNTDTAQYLPDTHAVLHYRGRRAFIISGMAEGEPFDQYSTGLFGIEGHEGTWRDADDGELSFCAVEHGRVDSTLRFKLQIAGHSSQRVHYWIAAGTSTREALYVHKQIREDGLSKRLHSTAAWWREWLAPALRVAEKIDSTYQESFLHSVMIVKSQIDKRGAVMASTDTAMLNYSRDAYAYCWPRDGAYALWPLIRMGYVDEPYRFFEFCRRGLHPGGFLMHKYRADGAIGSSWHPYVHPDGDSAPPIQEDETALVLFVFAQFYQMHPEPRLLNEFYHTLVAPMADFMAGYIDSTTGLPKASYNLWEEVYQTTTYTTAITYAALLAAADLAEIAEDPDNAVMWRSRADDIQVAAHKYLYNADKKCFYRGLNVHDEAIQYDDTIDVSSVFGAFMYGLFSVDSEELTTSIETVSRVFDSDNQIGMPRYENDNYRRVSQSVIGNWWPITTLWAAQYHLETGQSEKALKALEWVRAHGLETGVFPEQISPITDEPLSVAPLTWSHAEYIATLLDTISEKAS